MSHYHGGEALTDMAQEIQRAGFEIMTIDRYRQSCPRRKALLISHLAEGCNKDLSNLIPAICYSLESPIIASRYYHNIRSKTASFGYVFDWSGVSSRIDDKESRFIPISWPTTITEPIQPKEWSSKKFLIMISSNKRALQWFWPEFRRTNIKSFSRSLASNLRTTWIKSVDPFMKSELYSERLNAINFFSKFDSFDLYGGLWDGDANALEGEFENAVQRSYRGAIPDTAKIEYLKDYKFSLVYENTSFPGYLTEKIFDCFFAGVIPIYLGDPQIAHRIPLDCFIDARNFCSYEELGSYLLSIQDKESCKFLDAAQSLLKSPEFQRFTSKHFSRNILRCLREIEY